MTLISKEYQHNGYRTYIEWNDTTDKITIKNSSNSYVGEVLISDLDNYIELLDLIQDYEEYDEECEEYYHPSEVEIDSWFASHEYGIKFSDEYYGNYIVIDDAYDTLDSIRDFRDEYIQNDKIELKDLTRDTLKTYSLGRLNLLLNQVKGVVNGKNNQD